MLIRSPAKRRSPQQQNSTWQTPMIILIVILLAIIAIAVGGGSNQSWQSTSLTGHPLALLINPQNSQSFYAATEQGKILRSDDEGASWTDRSKGIAPNATISTLAASADGTLLFAGGNSNVYQSHDEGATWTAITGNLPHNEVFDALLPLTTNGSALLAGTSQSGIYRTSSSGNTWQQVIQGLPGNADIYALISIENNAAIFAGTIGSGVYISHDLGATWQPANSGIPDQYNIFAFVQPDPIHLPQMVIAGTNGGIYSTSDAGKTWRSANKGLPATRVLSLAADTSQPTTIIAGTDNGVYGTTNSGANWSIVQKQFASENHVGAVALLHVQGQTTIILAAADRLYRYPGQASLLAFGIGRLLGLIILVGLILFVMYRQNQFTRQISAKYDQQISELRAQRLANSPQKQEKPVKQLPSHIRGGPPPTESLSSTEATREENINE